MTNQFQQSEQERRSRNSLRIGTIFEADYSVPAFRVRDGDLETGWLHPLVTRAGNDADWWAYEVGEQVAFQMVSGGDSIGVIIGAIYQAKHPAPENTPDVRAMCFADGSFIRHDRDAGVLHLHSATQAVKVTSQNNVEVVAEKNVIVSAGGDVDIDAGGDAVVKADGDIALIAQQIELQSPQTTVTGLLKVTGGLVISGGEATSDGTIRAKEVIINDIKFTDHTHNESVGDQTSSPQ